MPNHLYSSASTTLIGGVLLFCVCRWITHTSFNFKDTSPAFCQSLLLIQCVLAVRIYQSVCWCYRCFVTYGLLIKSWCDVHLENQPHKGLHNIWHIPIFLLSQRKSLANRSGRYISIQKVHLKMTTRGQGAACLLSLNINSTAAYVDDWCS